MVAAAGIRYLWHTWNAETCEKAAPQRGDKETALHLFSSIGNHKDAETQAPLIQIEKARQPGILGN